MIREAVAAELARRPKGALAALARVIAAETGSMPKTINEQLSRWINDSRTDARANIPIRTLDRVCTHLELRLVPAEPGNK